MATTEGSEPLDFPTIDIGGPVEVHPTLYDFSGGNLGGQGVGICRTCGALVRADDQGIHTDWHAALDLGLGMRRISGV